MGPVDREKRVQIIEQSGEASGKFDHDGEEIIHGVMIVRNTDGVVLGKYRDEETSTVLSETKDPKTGKITRKQTGKKISGMEAARNACRVNGWLESRF